MEFMNRNASQEMPLPVLGLAEAVTSALTDAHWAQFMRNGFLDLGPICRPHEARALAEQTAGHIRSGALDFIHEDRLRPLVDLMHHPLLHETFARFFGPDAPVMVFRCEVVANTPANHAESSWRQNAGFLHEFDRDEVANVLVALDGGGSAIEALPCSHLRGLINPAGGEVPGREVERLLARSEPVHISLDPGHALLLHKWLVHRSGFSPGPEPSHFASFWYLDGRARSTITGYGALPMVAGNPPQGPYPCVKTLMAECVAQQERFKEAECYALSLEAERKRLQAELEKLKAG